MSVTRGDFLKQLTKSLPGLVFGTGAAAAEALLGKFAAVSGAPITPAPAAVARTEPRALGSIKSGRTDRWEVALTFDDGPCPGVTDLILDALKARDLHATFFMIGQCVAAAPELARRVLAEGHEIGNHTYTHTKLSELPEAQATSEIERTQEVMARELNHRPVWFRPPFGEYRSNQLGLIGKAGLRTVMWSVDTRDWSAPGEDKIAETVLEESAAGSIVLLHDSQPQSGKVIGAVLDGLLAKGLHPVPLSKILEAA